MLSSEQRRETTAHKTPAGSIHVRKVHNSLSMTEFSVTRSLLCPSQTDTRVMCDIKSCDVKIPVHLVVTSSNYGSQTNVAGITAQ